MESVRSEFSARLPLAAPVDGIPELGAACRVLAHRLDECGYPELLASVSPVSSAGPSPALWHVRGQLPPKLALAAELFAFGCPVCRRSLDALIGSDLVDVLLAGGLLRPSHGDKVSTAGLVLRMLWGLWYFHETPGPSPQLYYGDDSFSLMWRQTLPASGRCLDLCCGPGIQLLHHIRQGARGVGVEINRFAVGLAQINAAMNGLEGRARFERGHLYDPLGDGEKFDRIVANPPLLPFPELSPYPFVGHGGDDGFRLTWEILEGLPAVLKPGGFAQIINTCLSDGVELLVEPRLGAWAQRTGVDVVVTVISHVPHRPGVWLFEGLAKSASDSCGGDIKTIRHAMQKHLRRHAATHLAGISLRVAAGSGHCVVHDVSARDGASFFFR